MIKRIFSKNVTYTRIENTIPKRKKKLRKKQFLFEIGQHTHTQKEIRKNEGYLLRDTHIRGEVQKNLRLFKIKKNKKNETKKKMYTSEANLQITDKKKS